MEWGNERGNSKGRSRGNEGIREEWIESNKNIEDDLMHWMRFEMGETRDENSINNEWSLHCHWRIDSTRDTRWYLTSINEWTTQSIIKQCISPRNKHCNWVRKSNTFTTGSDLTDPSTPIESRQSPSLTLWANRDDAIAFSIPSSDRDNLKGNVYQC